MGDDVEEVVDVDGFVDDAEPAGPRPSSHEEKRPKMGANRVCVSCRGVSGRTKVQTESWRCRECRLKVCAHNSTEKSGADATCWPCKRVRSRRIVIR